jgi:cytochrome oxidase Cu insertion factor (SCO1/SenC/PrrC family)
MKAAFSAIAIFVFIHATSATAQSALRESPELAFNIPGQGEKLLSSYRGKVVALEFILTTCPHCQAASKVMTELQQRYGSRGFQALDIAVDPNADLRVENFAKDYQIGFPIGWMPVEQMMTYMGFTDRPVVPQLALIDRNGKIRYQTPRQGDGDSMKPEVIEKRIKELLELNVASRLRSAR